MFFLLQIYNAHYSQDYVCRNRLLITYHSLRNSRKSSSLFLESVSLHLSINIFYTRHKFTLNMSLSRHFVVIVVKFMA